MRRQFEDAAKYTPKGKAAKTKSHAQDDMRARLAALKDEDTPAKQLDDVKKIHAQRFREARERERMEEEAKKSEDAGTYTTPDEASKAKRKLSFSDYYAKRRDAEKAEYESAAAAIRAEFERQMQELERSRIGYDPGMASGLDPREGRRKSTPEEGKVAGLREDKEVSGKPQSTSTPSVASTSAGISVSTGHTKTEESEEGRTHSKSQTGTQKTLFPKSSKKVRKSRGSVGVKQTRKGKESITKAALQQALQNAEEKMRAREQDLLSRQSELLEEYARKQEARDRKDAERVAKAMGKLAKTPMKASTSTKSKKTPPARTMKAPTLKKGQTPKKLDDRHLLEHTCSK